jgi:hypothetical protein
MGVHPNLVRLILRTDYEISATMLESLRHIVFAIVPRQLNTLTANLSIHARRKSGTAV